MGKLTLKIDDLNVTSFDTGDGHRRDGTVHGHDTVETEWCTGYGHPGCNISARPECKTPRDTCFGTCGCSNGCETGNCG